MDADAGRSLGRLAEQVIKRRIELEMSKRNVAEAAEVSINTYQRIESGMPVRDITYAKIDAALKWAPGSCVAILEGQDPTPGRGGEKLTMTKIKIEPEDVTSAVGTAIIATRGDLTGDEISAINDKVIAELQRRGLI
jgi:transcriptional regulator with XRE-family HTH domain